jgi:hypothetical protein
LRVTAYDNAGNGSTATAHLYDDTALSLKGAWRRVSSTSAYRRSYAGSSSTAARAALSNVTGSTFTLYVRTCSSCGRIGVYDASGHRLAVVDTYSAATHMRVAKRVLSLPRPAKRSFVLRVLSAKNTRSSGRLVGIDAFGYA